MSVRATITAHTIPELEALVFVLALMSLRQMQDPPVRAYIPPLYGGKIRYVREPRGSEEWQTAKQTAARGYGDCEDLVGYRVAEIWLAAGILDPWRARGGIALPKVIEVSPTLRHVVVEHKDGTIEDPSAQLGMK